MRTNTSTTLNGTFIFTFIISTRLTTASERICMHTHAFGIGTLHELAGSSHFLGVLPALAFPTRSEAVAYLVAFGLGTIFAMAAFSWGMGWLAARFAKRGLNIYRRLMGACALAAMGVGCLWLATS